MGQGNGKPLRTVAIMKPRLWMRSRTALHISVYCPFENSQHFQNSFQYALIWTNNYQGVYESEDIFVWKSCLRVFYMGTWKFLLYLDCLMQVLTENLFLELLNKGISEWCTCSLKEIWTLPMSFPCHHLFPGIHMQVLIYLATVPCLCFFLVLQ